MAVTEVTIDEDQDVISFVVRGSLRLMLKYTLTEVGLVCSKSMSNDRASFDVSIATIFQGNSLDYIANVVKEYTIEVESLTVKKSPLT